MEPQGICMLHGSLWNLTSKIARWIYVYFPGGNTFCRNWCLVKNHSLTWRGRSAGLKYRRQWEGRPSRPARPLSCQIQNKDLRNFCIRSNFLITENKQADENYLIIGLQGFAETVVYHKPHCREALTKLIRTQPNLLDTNHIQKENIWLSLRH